MLTVSTKTMKPKNKNPANIPKDYADKREPYQPDWEDKDADLIGHARAWTTIIVFIVLVYLLVEAI